MGDCQSVPSRETPPFRRPITLLARGLFRSRTAFGLLNAVRIELNDASILSYEQPPTPPQNVLAVAIGPQLNIVRRTMTIPVGLRLKVSRSRDRKTGLDSPKEFYFLPRRRGLLAWSIPRGGFPRPWDPHGENPMPASTPPPQSAE